LPFRNTQRITMVNAISTRPNMTVSIIVVSDHLLVRCRRNPTDRRPPRDPEAVRNDLPRARAVGRVLRPRRQLRSPPRLLSECSMILPVESSGCQGGCVAGDQFPTWTPGECACRATASLLSHPQIG
jgi:hypothetical protein